MMCQGASYLAACKALPMRRDLTLWCVWHRDHAATLAAGALHDVQVAPKALHRRRAALQPVQAWQRGHHQLCSQRVC